MIRRATASAPGSIMISGEHAVVYGNPAIVCAIDQRITVEAVALNTPTLEINSGISDPVSLALSEVRPEGPYRFVLAAVLQIADQLDHGMRLDITSDIDPTLGLGSSAAVTIAALGALNAFSPLEDDLHSITLRIVRQLQGRGSGADLAASFAGGIVAYQLPDKMLQGTPPKDIRATMTSLLPLPTLSLRYSGYKTPTAKVLAKVAERMRGNEPLYEALYKRMGACTATTIERINAGDIEGFASEIDTYQGLMEELGVSDPTLDEIVQQARENEGTIAAKISGSGLGDCVVAFGAVPPNFQPVTVAKEGLIVHA